MDAGKTPTPSENESKNQTPYRSGVGKLLHMMRWLRPDILDASHELAKCMSKSDDKHMADMKQVMSYCLATPNRGWTLKPTRKWDGNPKFEFKVRGKSDLNSATNPTNCRSITGKVTYLEDAPVVIASKQQEGVTLSITEAKL